MDLRLKKQENTDSMNVQKRILKFVTFSNWIILGCIATAGLLLASPDFARGILFGGLIVTINFHLLYRTLKKALTPPHLTAYQIVIAKYYVRFLISGIIIYVLISQHYVNPIGLFIGLSVVVVSILLATMIEIKHLFYKEAV